MQKITLEELKTLLKEFDHLSKNHFGSSDKRMIEIIRAIQGEESDEFIYIEQVYKIKNEKLERH